MVFNKKLKISILLHLILSISIYKLEAQSIDVDQNPSGITWRQINTNDFQIIYPVSFETEAQRVANTLQKVIVEVSKSLNKHPKKISIILQNQSVVSNGFVTLGPRRSEFYTTPAQEFDSQDWLNSLAVHELRHVVQFDKLSGRFSGVPFLETYLGVVLNLEVPSWVWEGDAVGAETALTTTGRGRLPSFELAFRTNTLNGIRYSYVKNYLGSMKDMTPGYYPLGFFMTTKLRRDYGAGILDSIMTHVKNNPFRPYNLSHSIKKYTKMNTRQLHDATVAELNTRWQKQSDETNPASYPPINRRVDRVPVDYLLPVSLSDRETLVLKQGRKHTPMFVIINSNGTERKVFDIGSQVLPNFNYHAGKIVWDELRIDMRFQKRSFNVINIYDLKRKKYHQLTHRSRLFAPAFSPDGRTIIAVHVAYNNDISLVELDAINGHEIRRYVDPNKSNLQAPQFNADGSKIVCVSVSKVGAGVLEFNHASGLSTQLISCQKQQITRPTYAGRKVLFKAHYNGLDNIYSVDPDTKEVAQLSSAQYGAFNPSYDSVGKRIFFNNYQVSGLDATFMAYRDTDGTPISQLKNSFIDFAKPLVMQEGNQDIFDSIPTKKYISKPYHEFTNPFYFYNIQPIWTNMDQFRARNIGLQLVSTNKLNTMDINIGYQYDQEIKGDERFVGFTYKHFYPIFNFTYSNRKQLSYNQTNSGGEVSYTPFTWREHYTTLQVRIPFMLNQLNKTYSFGLNTSSSFTSRYDVSSTAVSRFITQLKFPMTYQVYFNRSTNKSKMDLVPRWGQGVNIAYYNFPFSNNQSGYLLSLKSIFLTPGLGCNHSFQAGFNYQKSTGNYQYTIDIPMVSGYGNLSPTSNLKNTLLLSYQFPIAYPDWEIGPLAYVKRLRAGFFSDFENIGAYSPCAPRTYGITVGADMNLLRFDFLTSGLSGKLIFATQESLLNPIFQFGLNINY